jgi:hypothetical protein
VASPSRVTVEPLIVAATSHPLIDANNAAQRAVPVFDNG